MMPEPTWLPRITKSKEAYLLLADDGLGEEDHDTYLVLIAENGAEFRLKLSPEACASLYDSLTLILQSENSPLQRINPKQDRAN